MVVAEVLSALGITGAAGSAVELVLIIAGVAVAYEAIKKLAG